ncbi:MAG: hypothetical protein KDA79_24500, partial [Planctomycetaceae bacterium]|nr:hypothetical protein [Planctomycetaceae bacterium]
RPPDGELTLFHEYWSGIDQCTRRAEEPFHNARGEFIGKPEDQAEIDWRFAEERRELIDTLLERYSLNADELATTIARVSLWRQGIVPTDEDVARTAKSYQERWADE